MSKRYGRNQRRKHRELINQQATKITQLSNQRVEYRNLKLLVDDWNNRMESLFGKETLLKVGIQTTTYNYENRSSVRIAHINNVGSYDYAQMTECQMYRISVIVEEDPVKYSKYLGILIGDRVERSMMYTPEAIERLLGRSDEEVYFIASEIARKLLKRD